MGRYCCTSTNVCDKHKESQLNPKEHSGLITKGGYSKEEIDAMWEEAQDRRRKEWEEKEKKESKETNPLRLVLPDEVREKIHYWVMKAPGECSGLGKVQFVKEQNVLYVHSAYMLKQKNTGASTELDPAEISRLMFTSRNAPGELRWWWHSHAGMPTFWSGTDTDTFKEFGKNGWICGTVFNKARSMLSALYVNSPMNLWVPEIPTVLLKIEAPVPKEWEEEYDAATKDDKPNYPIIGSGNTSTGPALNNPAGPPPLPKHRRRKRKNRDSRWKPGMN